MRIFLCTSVFVFYVFFNGYGQLPADQVARIDALFEDWQQPNHPGGSIGIMKNGQVVYLKAYGLASLEYQVPNSTNTLFNVASVSKQLTAMGIVLLHLEGKIDIDADINTYLPNMPAFKYPITIRHMLHHTSGLRSFHAVLELAGWRKDDLRTNDDIYQLIERQNDLNFDPNDDYLYCNTGYILMSKIIETVTGEDFSLWMKQTVFDKLGMFDTYVEDKYNRVVPNNATSYYNNDGVFERAVEYWGYVGSGNVHTTATDLLKWLSNYSSPQEGWDDAFEMMQTLDYFNNGRLNNYAFGIIVDRANGYKQLQHSGSIGGFRAFSSNYPEADLSIAILTNFSTSNPRQLEKEIFEIVVPVQGKLAVDIEKSVSKRRNKDLKTGTMARFAGDYWSQRSLASLNIKIKNDSIKVLQDGKPEEDLIYMDANVYRSATSPNTVYRFKVSDKEINEISLVEPQKDTIKYHRYQKTTPTETELKAYEGRYYSEELETFYDLYYKEGSLYSHHSRHGDAKVEWVKKDVLKGRYPFSSLVIRRDAQQHINGLEVNNGRVRHAWFKKIILKE